MNKYYVPELGQLCFGQPWQPVECPEYIVALLRYLEYEMKILYENVNDKDYDSPFSNTGNKFVNDTFEVYAYSWNEEVPQPYNFRYNKKHIDISWYKYLGRGTTINKPITTLDAVEMFEDCLDSLNEESLKEKK